MTASFPHRYTVELAWTGDRRAVLEAPPRTKLTGGPPPEFGGTSLDWSPEHLLLAALDLCLMTTFTALAQRAKLTVFGYESRAEATLDKTREGLQFTRLRVQVRLLVPGDQSALAEETLLHAKKRCIISNALKVPVELAHAIEVTAAPA